MTFQTTMMLLRLIHILAGLFWAGAVVVFAAFLVPATRACGPAGGKVMQQLMQHRRLALSFMVSAILTILSGIVMYALMGAGSFGAWMRSPMGATLGIGGVAALIAAGIGAGVLAPASLKLQAIGARAQEASSNDAASDRRPSAEIMTEILRIQQRIGRAAATAAALLVVAASAMAVARYV
jgi:uncharacterized membrane protein